MLGMSQVTKVPLFAVVWQPQKAIHQLNTRDRTLLVAHQPIRQLVPRTNEIENSPLFRYVFLPSTATWQEPEKEKKKKRQGDAPGYIAGFQDSEATSH